MSILLIITISFQAGTVVHSVLKENVYIYKVLSVLNQEQAISYLRIHSSRVEDLFLTELMVAGRIRGDGRG